MRKFIQISIWDNVQIFDIYTLNVCFVGINTGEDRVHIFFAQGNGFIDGAYIGGQKI